MATNSRLTTERDPQSPKQWQCGDPPEYQRSPKRDSDGKPLEKVYKWMKEYDKGMCDAWRDEIEKLLIFAGLFAATVTVFVIDSYKWLQEDNAAASTKLLAQISLQLAAMANNSTQPALSLPDSSAFVPLSRNVRINIAWFLSLIICLSTVILGILCLQWLREYTRELSLPSFDAIAIRQIRFEGLIYWKVPDIISFLPMALQVSVLLFFGGILDLLWSLHPAVAGATTIVVGLVAAALVFTAIVPVVQNARYFYRSTLRAVTKQCPYKSPFSWLFLRLAMFMDRHSFRMINYSYYTSTGRLTSWDEVDVAWEIGQADILEDKEFYNVQGLAKALHWTIQKLTPAGAQSDIIPEIFHSLHSDLPTRVSHKTLQSWATFIDDKDHNVIVALSLDEYDQRERSVQYDLLMTWFLDRHSFILNCDDLLMELRLRCMNTLIDRMQMNEMFDEVLQDYTFTMTPNDIENGSEGELRFQIMTTILDYHRRHGDSSSRETLRRVDLIGHAMAEYIRCTPVKADNALMRYEILRRFEGLLEDTRSSVQHRSTSIHDQTVSQSEVRLYLELAVSMFGLLDLRKVEEWEKDITRITDKRILVSGQLNLFLQQDLLPALDAQETLASLATQVRHQLTYAHRDIDPLINRSDTAETELDDSYVNEVGREPVT